MAVQTKWRDDNATVVVPAMQMRLLLVLLRTMHLRDRGEVISVRRRAEMGWRGRVVYVVDIQSLLPTWTWMLPDNTRRRRNWRLT